MVISSACSIINGIYNITVEMTGMIVRAIDMIIVIINDMGGVGMVMISVIICMLAISSCRKSNQQGKQWEEKNG